MHDIDFDFTNDEVYGGMSTPAGSLDFPSILRHQDVGDYFTASPESHLLFGASGDGNNVTVDLDSDSPHVLVSAGSGTGKSVIARSLATQGLLKGYSVVFLDIKQISHMWAEGLPNVHYASNADHIGGALRQVAMEVHRRMRKIKESPFGTEVDVGPRILIIYEEMNSTVDTLKDLDKRLPPRGIYKAMDAFGDIMNLGRAAKVHVVGFAQYADATTIPTKWRESFGYRVLIKHSSNAWNMLAWQAGYCPPAPQKPGRGFTVQGDRAIETQFLLLEEEECAALVRKAHAGQRKPTRGERLRARHETTRRQLQGRKALIQATGKRVA